MQADYLSIDRGEFSGFLEGLPSLSAFSNFREHRIFSDEELDRITRYGLLQAAKSPMMVCGVMLEENTVLGFCLCSPLDWDSAYFNISAAKITCFMLSQCSVEKVEFLISKTLDESVIRHKFTHISCEISMNDYSLLNGFSACGFQIMDVKKTFVAHKDIKLGVNKNYGFPVRDYQSNDAVRLYGLYLDQRFESRYTRDPFFDVKKVGDMYKSWISNIIDAGPGKSLVKVVERGEKIIAAGGIIEIDFSAAGVNKAFMGNGVFACSREATGSYMGVLRSLIEDGWRRGYVLMETKVSMNNTAANRVLERLGARSAGVYYALHFNTKKTIRRQSEE
ncbi:MAG: hypothetical protein PSX71_13485 [bacterium]|nr:hypothetical protein [bacterium]